MSEKLNSGSRVQRVVYRETGFKSCVIEKLNLGFKSCVIEKRVGSKVLSFRNFGFKGSELCIEKLGSRVVSLRNLILGSRVVSLRNLISGFEVGFS